MFFIATGNWDHAFVCSKKDGYYDKQDRCDVEATKFMAKTPGGQVIYLNVDTSKNLDYEDDSWGIIEDLSEVIDGNAKLEDYAAFSIRELITNIKDL